LILLARAKGPGYRWRGNQRRRIRVIRRIAFAAAAKSDCAEPENLGKMPSITHSRVNP
jgi:hypothetical protein